MGAKEDAIRKLNQARAFEALLDKYRALYGLNDKQMQDILGVGRSTYYAIKNDASHVTIEMLQRMRIGLQIPKEELLKVI